MAAMVVFLIIALLECISININTAVSRPPPLNSQLFSPRLLKAAPSLYSLAVFVWISSYVFQSCLINRGYSFTSF